jgi:creatinine amidohydrolase/Fe(II)-dependent formamide hydrolase-like protein
VQVRAVKAAAEQHMVEGSAKVWALCEPELSGEVEVGSDHAGKWETSLFWAMYPELVDMDRCPDPDTGQFLWCSKEALEASPELGRKLVEYIADRLGEGAAKLLAERRAAG